MDIGIPRNQMQPFELGLRDEEPVEWVAVVIRQSRRRQYMFGENRQGKKREGPEPRRKPRRGITRYSERPKGDFACDFPRNGG